MKLEVANRAVKRLHRHHDPVPGHLWSTAALEGRRLVGVVIVGRPVARGFDDGETVEVLRCATDGSPNACSFLYGAANRARREIGYRRIITYTLAEEGGASLRAAGWRPVATIAGRAWSCESRPRRSRAEVEEADKVRWELEG